MEANVSYSSLSGFRCCLAQLPPDIRSTSRCRGGLSLSCHSQRQLRWSWAVPGHSFLSLSTPDLGAAQPGHQRLLQGFDLSCTYCKMQRLLEISHTVNHQVIKQHFCSNLVEQLDKLRECNFSHFKWQQLIALLYPRCFSLSHLL